MLHEDIYSYVRKWWIYPYSIPNTQIQMTIQIIDKCFAL